MLLDSTESAEDMEPDPVTPEPSQETDTWLEDLTTSYKTYLLEHADRSAFKVVQYVSDPETDYTISKFLEFCLDTGWTVNEEA